jgi:CheY-like chemotaxis protein
VAGAARVLIVEDEPDFADNLLEVLEEFGVSARVAASAEAALALLESESFEGVVTDYRLPGISGVELIRRMRKEKIELPVVLLSGFLDHQAEDAAIEAGALDILQKPVDVERLASDVAEFGKSTRGVLLVEDNPALAENIGEALRSHGVTTFIATSATEALSLRKLPCVAIVDLRLPDGNGIRVARRLARRDPSIRIVFVSGFTQHYLEELQLLSDEVRTVDELQLWLDKPFDVAHLAKSVSVAAERA